MNDMRKLMETVEKINESGTMPTIESVRAWKVVDEMGESVFHTNVKKAIIDYAESYAESQTEFGTDEEVWDEYFDTGKKRAQDIISKSKK